jgi:predicted ATPase
MSETASLKISNFSCIDDAHVILGNLTVLIGPQASGKSIISKLFYFCFDIIDKPFYINEEEFSIKKFNANIVERFKQWFPPQTWGKRRFCIEFTAGKFSLTIQRTVSANKAGKNVRITFSDYFDEQYKLLETTFNEKLGKATDPETFSQKNMEYLWRLDNTAKRRMIKDLNSSFIASQTFVPAGRSFFTSIGKAVAVFESGNIFDPVTLTFGRLFSALRDGARPIYYPNFPEHKTTVSHRYNIQNRLFGGDIHLDRGKEYIESRDGRKIPFSLLSSGQQELLPLWLVLDHIVKTGRERCLLYIEEPEAHLFPTAQNVLVEYLASVASTKMRRSLFITTHSPYLLSKLNVLIKAGIIITRARKTGAKRATASDNKASIEAIQKKVAAIVPKDSWLLPSEVNAYAVADRRVMSILDDDGLIDGEYLDSASSELSAEFFGLLEIENEQN